MATRLTRTQQVVRNRDLVLDAARAVFTETGYAKATLETIAERAGFSKGVVYSQFDSKADLFFALLERRILERAEQNRAIAESLTPDEAVATLIRAGERDAVNEVNWQRLLIEFRVHASYDEELNGRYATLHARTVETFAALIRDLYERAGLDPRVTPRVLAEFVLAVANGLTLERATTPDALPTNDLIALVTRAIGLDGRTS